MAKLQQSGDYKTVFPDGRRKIEKKKKLEPPTTSLRRSQDMEGHGPTFTVSGSLTALSVCAIKETRR
jgi:hypothetical protein